MKKNVSLKDIALELGVSVSLVSYVLNGHSEKKRVGEAVSKKILATAKKLHYQPNQIAKSLKTRKTHTIGLIVADGDNVNYNFTTGITRAVEAAAKARNYTVFIGNNHEDLQILTELVQAFTHRQVDGLIIAGVEDCSALVKSLRDREMPFVLIDRIFPKVKTNFIGVDNFQMAYAGTEYLFKRKFRRIAFMNYETSFFHLHERDRGYRQALADNGIKPDKKLELKVRKTHFAEDVRKHVKTIAGGAGEVIFFATDTLAINGIRFLVEMGYKIPADVSVLSFDASNAFDLFSCPVTHFQQPMEQMGEDAVKLLFDAMDEIKPPRQIQLLAAFVPGKSCGE